MNRLLILLFVLECSLFLQVLAASPAKPICTKLEDTICPKRSAIFCSKSKNFRFQCPRKCGVCVDKPAVLKHLVTVDKARLVITEVVQDVIKSSILTSLTSNSTAKPKNLNQVNEVMYQIERSVGQADLSRKKYKLPELKSDIKEAVKLGNMKFARRTVAIALHAIAKASSRAAGRRKRSATAVDPKKFLADLRKDLGEEKFSKLLGLDGGKTLMFAIDITGSMWGEIRAAKAIATEISTYERLSPPSNYILSSFGDPIATQSRLVQKGEKEVKEFIDEIGKLKAKGGGDCPEYAFDGMFAAIEEGPEFGSPLFVFTDAPPKDANEHDNLDGLLALAEEVGVNINFFTQETCGNSAYTFESFKQVSSETGGSYLPIKEAELERMANFTDTKLGTLATVKTGGTLSKTRKKRSTVDEILITLDDTVDKLVVSTSTEHSAADVRLRAPSGIPWTEGKNMMTNAAIFIVDLPVDGDWKLEIPASAGKYDYSVKVSSTENIDFKHEFKKSVNRKRLDLKYPLAGEPAELEIRIAGEKQVKKESLRVDIVDISGNVLIPDLKPTPNDVVGVYYTLTFTPPNEKFKIVLRGMTSKNKTFHRTSERANQVKSLVLKEFYNSKRNLIRPGGSVFIMLYLFNGKDSNQVFRVSFKDTLGYNVSLLGRRRLTVRAKSKKFLRVAVRYSGGKRGREGQNENVIILVKGPDGSVASEVVPLMVKS